MIRIALLAGLLALAAPAASAGEVVDVDSAGLQRLILSGVPVVDLRRQDEWRETGIVAGSHRVTLVDAAGRLNPAFGAELSRAVKPGQPVALICRTGNRSAAAAHMLAEQLGFARVYNVREGITRWITEGRPVISCGKC